MRGEKESKGRQPASLEGSAGPSGACESRASAAHSEALSGFRRKPSARAKLARRAAARVERSDRPRWSEATVRAKRGGRAIPARRSQTLKS